MTLSYLKQKLMNNKIIFICFFMSVFLISYGASINDMNKKLKDIDKQIESKNARIKNINVETGKLSDQIKKLEIEIKKDEKEQQNIAEEITVVEKNIDYGQKNLEIAEEEIGLKSSEYSAKILAWDKYSKILGDETNKRYELKKQYRDVLNGDLNRIDYIIKIEEKIKKYKSEIENQKAKLDKLKKELSNSISESNKKKAKHSELISKLNSEKKTHQKNIESLKKEKTRISKEIERIIRENAKKNSQKKGSTTQKTSMSSSKAYQIIGKTTKPLNGSIVVAFHEKKSGLVESNGIEIAGKVGSNIVASKSGKVIYADKFQGLGKVVMIDHGNDIIGVYGNLISLKVSVNSKVNEGQSIGSLGLSSENKPRLYYELRANLNPINPVPTFK